MNNKIYTVEQLKRSVQWMRHDIEKLGPRIQQLSDAIASLQEHLDRIAAATETDGIVKLEESTLHSPLIKRLRKEGFLSMQDIYDTSPKLILTLPGIGPVAFADIIAELERLKYDKWSWYARHGLVAPTDR